MSKKRIKSPYCLNCGKILQDTDNYCSNCGQENDNKRKNIGKVFIESIQKFLHFDSKIYHSIPALLFRPGFLSTEYLNGKRQRHLDPVKMFITILLIFFVVSHLSDDDESLPGPVVYTSTTKSEGPPQKSPKINFSIGKPEGAVISTDSALKVADSLDLDLWYYSEAKEFTKRGGKQPSELIDSLGLQNTFLNRFYFGQLIKFASMEFKEFQQYLSSKAPWIIFSMIPFFALLLKLLYIRRKLLYIDHLIFAFHVHAFYFLLGTIHVLYNMCFDFEINGIFAASYIGYTLLALKNFYRQSWIKTILKLILLLIIYAILSWIIFLLSLILIFLIF